MQELRAQMPDQSDRQDSRRRPVSTLNTKEDIGKLAKGLEKEVRKKVQAKDRASAISIRSPATYAATAIGRCLRRIERRHARRTHRECLYCHRYSRKCRERTSAKELYETTVEAIGETLKVRARTA